MPRRPKNNFFEDYEKLFANDKKLKEYVENYLEASDYFLAKVNTLLQNDKVEKELEEGSEVAINLYDDVDASTIYTVIGGKENKEVTVMKQTLGDDYYDLLTININPKEKKIVINNDAEIKEKKGILNRDITVFISPEKTSYELFAEYLSHSGNRLAKFEGKKEWNTNELIRENNRINELIKSILYTAEEIDSNFKNVVKQLKQKKNKKSK